MRKGIHPEYKDAKVICSCGAVFDVKSTEKEIRVETCINLTKNTVLIQKMSNSSFFLLKLIQEE